MVLCAAVCSGGIVVVAVTAVVAVVAMEAVGTLSEQH